MSSNNWKLELNRMLDSFANQAESSLDIINREFKAMGRSFDEDFRQYFLDVSNARLDSSYKKIALNHWDEEQIQGIENRFHSAAVSTGTSMESNKIQNSNAAAESDRDKTNTHNVEIVNENGSDASMQGDNDDDGTGDVEIKDEVDTSVKFEMEDTLLPMVTFDPNHSNDESDAERAVPTPQKGQNRTSRRPPPPTKQARKKMERSTSKRHKCKLCDYATNNNAHLNRHQKVHVDGKLIGVVRDGNNLYHCTLCDRQFTSLNHLSKHMKLHEDGELLYDCNRCMRQFVQKATKDQHEILCNGHHFECHLCKVYVTSNKFHIQMHMRTHSGAKPFGCMVCDKFFKQKGNLRHHLNTVHSRTQAT